MNPNGGVESRVATRGKKAEQKAPGMAKMAEMLVDLGGHTEAEGDRS